jgi:phosphate transport system substrate-binding protein
VLSRFVFILFLIVNISLADNLKIVGGTTIQPIVESLRDAYKSFTGTDLVVSGGGTSVAFRDFDGKLADVGMIARSLSEEEKSKYAYVTIGYDVIVIIVNEKNPIKTITKEQLHDIYLGRVTNWQGINGINENIIATSKSYGRGSLTIFEEFLGLYSLQNPKAISHTKHITDQAWVGGANNDVLVWIGGLENGIGFISYGNAIDAINHGMPIKIIDIEGYPFSTQSVKNGTYPLTRELNLIYSKDNKQSVHFINWMLSNTPQQAVKKNYFIGVLDE